jgi:hypothetical protein
MVRMSSKTNNCGPSTRGFMLNSVAKSTTDENRGLPVTHNKEPETKAIVLEHYSLNSVLIGEILR